MNYDKPERQYNVAQAQAGQAYGGTLGALPTLGDAPKPMPRLDGPANHLEEMTKGLAELNMRLARVADRLGGSTPEPVEKEGNGISAGCVAGRYERISDTYSTLIRKLFSTAERLEQL